MQYILSFLILIAFVCSGCRGGTSLYQASSKGNIKVVKTLIESGSNVNQHAEFGLTPLMAASKSNNFRAMKILISNGADVNAKDHFRKSALWYAYDYESFDAFKLLLENGAKIDFPLSYETAPTLYKKKKLYRLAKEYTLFNKIKKQKNNPDMSLFYSYFSEFSDGGYYTSEIKPIFEEIVRNDYDKIRSSSSPSELQRFLNKYSNIGRKYYVVTADILNVRSANSATAEKTGEYARGDKIYAVAEKDGWIQTDIGWVSKTYIQPITQNIWIVTKYVQKIENKLRSLTASSRSETTYKNEKPVSENRTQSPRFQAPALEREETSALEQEETPNWERNSNIPADSNVATVQKELDSILESATLPKLETFINKYKEHAAYHLLVKKARDVYKTILLRDLR